MNQANIFQDNVQALRRGAMSGAHVARLMEVCDVSISDVARSLQVDQARVREVRAAGVAGALYVEDWIWGIQKAMTPAAPPPATRRAMHHQHPASDTPAIAAVTRWALLDRIAPGFVAGREPTYGALSRAWWRLTAAERRLFESLDAFGFAIWARVDPDGCARETRTGANA